MICSRYQIAIVPFPFVDIDVAKPRPALVLSSHRFNADCGQTILAMITTAALSHWSTDIALKTLAGTGLRVPCVVRFKLFTLSNDLIARSVGTLATADARRVDKAVMGVLADE
jgi:mRNA interferase MazF